jgi:YHS domain-containing protein
MSGIKRWIEDELEAGRLSQCDVCHEYASTKTAIEDGSLLFCSPKCYDEFKEVMELIANEKDNHDKGRVC